MSRGNLDRVLVRFCIFLQLMDLPFKLRFGRRIMPEAIVLSRQKAEDKNSTGHVVINGVVKKFTCRIGELTAFETRQQLSLLGIFSRPLDNVFIL